MSDTITKTCLCCYEDFDSIPTLDKGICDECKEEWKFTDEEIETIILANKAGLNFSKKDEDGLHFLGTEKQWSKYEELKIN